MESTQPEEVTQKRVRKLKVIEVKSRRRFLWAGPATAVFLAFILVMNIPSKVAGQDDYTFGTEQVNKGGSVSPSNKDSEDGSFNSLVESDQYADTNYSGSSESMTYGTTGGGSFPSALDTDDGTRRNYIESNLAPANYIVYLFPSSDAQDQFTQYPASPTTNYDKVDETTNEGNGDTDYVYPSSTANVDRYNMQDMSAPSGSPTLQIRMWAYAERTGGGGANINGGIRISTTDYPAFSQSPANGVYTNYSKGWTMNPSTSSAWAYTEINALVTYLGSSDISPVPRVTQVGIIVWVNYSATDWQMQGTLTYNSVVASSQTIGFQVLCQGYRSGTEDFYVQAWNYTSSAWVTKTTVQAASDTDYNFNLLGWNSNCERSSGDVVQLRVIDVTGTDSVQDTLYLDLLKIQRIETGYALDVELSATTVAQYGNITLRIKGYTSAETFKVNVWNYSSAAYDLNKLSITSLSNAWQTTLDLCDGHHRSGTTVKIQFMDGTASTSDFVRDTLYLDVVWVTRYHTNPTVTLYGAMPTEVNLGTSIIFWCTYSDYDDEAPSYVYAHIGSTDYSMNANDSDTLYYDGKLYGLTKSDIPAGNITYYFKVKDTNSVDVTTSQVAISVNTKPTLTLDGVTPNAGPPGNYDFFVTYTDADSNSPKYVKVWIAGQAHVMTYNGTGGGYHLPHWIDGGQTEYYFTTEDYRSGEITTSPKYLEVETIPELKDFGRTPADPVYLNSELNFTMTVSNADNDAPTIVKWREDSGATQNITMIELDPSDTNYVDGKDFYVLAYFNTHGLHYWDFGALTDVGWVTGGSDSLTIDNRDPSISNGPSPPIDLYRNQAWYYDFDATDPDTDNIYWEAAGPGWLSIESGTGNLSGTTPNTPDEYEFSIWANDSFGGSDLLVLPFHVVNRAPVISSTGNASQIGGSYLAYHVVASDLDSDTLTYELSSNATWASISGEWVNGTVTGPGWFEFSVWVNDSYTGSDLEHWHFQVVLNIPPYFTSTPVYLGTIGTTYNYHAEATDPDDDVLVFDLGPMTNATFLTIDEDTGIVTGIPDSVGYFWVNVSISEVGTIEEFTVWQNYTLTISQYNAPALPSGPIQISMGVVLMGVVLVMAGMVVWKYV